MFLLFVLRTKDSKYLHTENGKYREIINTNLTYLQGDIYKM